MVEGHLLSLGHLTSSFSSPPRSNKPVEFEWYHSSLVTQRHIFTMARISSYTTKFQLLPSTGSRDACGLCSGMYRAFPVKNLRNRLNETKFLTFSVVVPLHFQSYRTKGKVKMTLHIFSILVSSAGLPLCLQVILYFGKSS